MRMTLGSLVIAALVVGCGSPVATQVPSGSAAPSTTAASVAPAPSSIGEFGGTVTYQLDGSPATTAIDAVASGTGLSGTAVTTFGEGKHTVRVECADKDAGNWMLGGTVASTTVHGESAGAWSAVIVRDGSPKKIGIWLSAGPEAGATCDEFLSSIDPGEIDASLFWPIESGELIPPA